MGHKKSKEEQLSLFKRKIIRQFGGTLLKGNAKSARPLSTKEAVHLVLKSAQAIGTKSMLHTYNVSKIDEIIRNHARLCRIRIYHLVNVGNHLHLVIKLDDRKEFQKFIRVITGLIARHIEISAVLLGVASGRIRKKSVLGGSPLHSTHCLGSGL
ncbi:MAG: transposase [Bdellovibrionales bacterium]|nr:transposase [Bdellovibrionales bacterium]